MNRKLLAGLFLIFANLFHAAAQDSKFDYLKIKKNRVKTTHQAR